MSEPIGQPSIADGLIRDLWDFMPTGSDTNNVADEVKAKVITNPQSGGQWFCHLHRLKLQAPGKG